MSLKYLLFGLSILWSVEYAEANIIAHTVNINPCTKVMFDLKKVDKDWLLPKFTVSENSFGVDYAPSSLAFSEEVSAADSPGTGSEILVEPETDSGADLPNAKVKVACDGAAAFVFQKPHRLEIISFEVDLQVVRSSTGKEIDDSVAFGIRGRIESIKKSMSLTKQWLPGPSPSLRSDSSANGSGSQIFQYSHKKFEKGPCSEKLTLSFSPYISSKEQKFLQQITLLRTRNLSFRFVPCDNT
jgi:hypothetical protein